MDPFFIWLEETAPSVWIRESHSMLAFPGILALHTIGMAFLVGTSVAISLRTLGVASGVPPRRLLQFTPVMWMGLALNAVSGVALLVAYPTKALTNPVFYGKLALIAVALVLTVRLIDRVPGPDAGEVAAQARGIAGFTILTWACAITAGRFLAYTYTRLLSTGFF
jgi:hypothetical protein